ncbi:MAG: Ger(x)C family spore germination protein [Firmicutes bacterium]|nr:Ger(x)C family spore germination protein [Bacillota bacterium]
MKKIIVLIIIPFLLSGCYDYNELNDIAIVSGVGIDYNNEKYNVTFEIISTKKTGDTSGSSSSYTVSSEASTITEAFLKIGNSLDKVAYYDHIEMVVIDEKIAKNKMVEVSEFLIRSPKLRNEFYLALAKDTTAKKLLNTTSKEKPLASSFMIDLLEHNNDADSAGYYVPFTETLSNILTNGEDAILSAFTVKEDKIVLDGMGIFKDYKLKTILENKYAPTINLLNNFNIQNILYESTCSDNKKIVISIYEGKVKYEPNANYITVKADLNARIHEDNCNGSLREVDTYKELEKEFIKVIKNEMDKVINILKSNESNVLKTGLYEHIKFRNNNYYSWINKEFKYEINLKINKKGLIFEVKK